VGNVPITLFIGTNVQSASKHILYSLPSEPVRHMVEYDNNPKTNSYVVTAIIADENGMYLRLNCQPF